MSGEYDPREAAAIADVLCGEVLSISRTSRLVNPSQEVPEESVETFNVLLARLLSGEPLQYVLGFADFYGHRFRVSPSVLIPRPETELLCDKAIALVRSCFPDFSGSCGGNAGNGAGRRLRILDLCTGSGCIAWTMAAAFPGAEVVAVDISEDALGLAREQDVCPGAPVFIRSDVLSPSLPDNIPGGGFDVILSNPPYVTESERALMRRNVLEHEPALALFVPDDDPLVFYRAIASQLPVLLNPGGFCLVEINESFGPQTAAVFSAPSGALTSTGPDTSAGHPVEVLCDLSGRDRFILVGQAGNRTMAESV